MNFGFFICINWFSKRSEAIRLFIPADWTNTMCSNFEECLNYDKKHEDCFQQIHLP